MEAISLPHISSPPKQLSGLIYPEFKQRKEKGTVSVLLFTPHCARQIVDVPIHCESAYCELKNKWYIAQMGSSGTKNYCPGT